MNVLLLNLLPNRKQFETRINLISYFHHANQPVATKELQRNMNVTMPTVKREMEILNQEMADYLTFVQPSYGMHSLEISKHESIDTINNALAKGTLVYRILEYLLHNRKMSFWESADYLCVSTATLARTIQHMNEVLKGYNIRICSSNLKFFGTERDIRTFFYDFFIEFSDGSILSPDLEADAFEFIEYLKKHNVLSINYNLYRVALWTMIIKTRWKSHCFINCEFPYLDMIVNDQHFINFQKTIKKWNWGISYLPQHEIVWSYLCLLHCISYSDSIAIDEDTYHYCFHAFHEATVLEQIHYCINTYIPALEADARTHAKLEYLLLNTYLLSQISRTFERVPVSLRAYMNQEHPDIVAACGDYLNKILAHSDIGFEHPDDIAIQMAIILLSRTQVDDSKPLKIVLAIRGAAGFDHYIAENLKKHILAQVETGVFIRFNSLRNENHLDSAHLIIHNFHMSKAKEFHCPRYRIPSTPTHHDWENLDRYMKQFIKQERM